MIRSNLKQAMARLFISIFMCLPILAFAQYNNANFGGSGVSVSYYPSGSDGTDQGDIILYENVSTVNGNSVDCYIVVDTVTGNSMTTVDQNSTSGSGYSNNQSRFFSPFMNFSSGGGTAKFTFQFIEDGSFSYNTGSGVVSATNTTVDSVRINSYDLDGNGNSNSYQYTEFSNFTSSEVDANTNLSTSTTGSLTRWISTSTTNTTSITDNRNRVRVFYDTISSFQAGIGTGASGYAYFFIDFASGFAFSSPETFYQVSGNILNDTNGLHNNTLVDGSGIGIAGTTQLYANLVGDNGAVVQSVAVDSNGSYDFLVVAEGSYTVLLSTSALTVGSTGNSSSVPTNWVNTGENIGFASGNDGTANGVIAVTVNGASVSNVNFGINQRPVSLFISNEIDVPTAGDTLHVGATILKAGGYGDVPSGGDNEETTIASPLSIQITALPADTNKLIYDGSVLEFGEDGVNPPSTSNPLVITNFDYTKLSFVVNDGTDVKFDYAVVDAAGYADLSPTRYEYFWSGNVVPVELVAFDVVTIGNNAELTWVTASEINNKGFEIYRSVDFGASFEYLDFVEGNGTSMELKEYTYTDFDARIANNKVVWYKLKQVDFDGKSELSDAKAAKWTKNSEISIYPNPSVDVVNVEFERTEESATVKLLTLEGKVLESKLIYDNESCSFDTNHLIVGIYFIQIEDGIYTHTNKIIVNP